MSKCTDATIELWRLGRRVIEADFEGGDISTDGGFLLLRRVDECIGLSHAAAAVPNDQRDPARITHSLRDLLAQRIYGLCCDCKDLNDHDTLRSVLLMQTAVGVVDALASSPTLRRLELRATRAQAVALHGVLIEQFITSHKTAPEELALDIDAADVPLHGAQESREFHAYYDHHCYLPLYVFYGEAMLGMRAAAEPYRRGQERRGRDQVARGPAAPGLARREDRRARRLGVLPPEPVAPVRTPGRELHRRPGAQCEAEAHGAVRRGDARRRVRMHRPRSIALAGSESERATAAPIRVRLLKIGAAAVRNTRRVRVLLASHHLLRELFAQAAARLSVASP